MSCPPKLSVPSLQDELDRITRKTRALVQPERLAVSERAAAELFATGIEDRVLPQGSRAPGFSLVDARTNKAINSVDILAIGPLIVKFFRGRWCPYCSTELKVWSDLYPEIRRRGAFFVAVSPQTPKHNGFTLEQHQLQFPVLSDPGARVAAQFGAAYTVSEEQRDYYQRILVNIPYVNAGATYRNAPESSWRLPVPAVFLILQDGSIAFSRGYADFRVRPEPAEVLDALEAARHIT